MNWVLIWGGYNFSDKTVQKNGQLCHPSVAWLCRIPRENSANILEGVTYFPTTSLNPLRVKPLFLEALILSSTWRFSDVTWSDSASASLDGSYACDSPKSLSLLAWNPARFTIILWFICLMFALHCQMFMTPSDQRIWPSETLTDIVERGRGGERRAFVFVLRWLWLPVTS